MIQQFAYDRVVESKNNGTFSQGRRLNGCMVNFKATKGWAASFFSRYPDVRKMYEKTLELRKRNRKPKKEWKPYPDKLQLFCGDSSSMKDN